ncbi:GerMN domain-containing protein [Piscinibacter sp. Jin2]|uniref:GerMN domain-containing protein n=1 Tax=Aquariibacter lacus TaxID=2801332 RepID=A0A9X0XDR7_9BURK|nr:GerMN domain-containing protein [Piscinibacter lacus]MBL0720070.1 GerMN domain-containing protein [Piscinibacter lacus]
MTHAPARPIAPTAPAAPAAPPRGLPGWPALALLLACLAAALPGQAAEPAARAESTMVLNLHFRNERLADDPENCAEVHPAQRVLPASRGVGRAALNQLFAGPSEPEQAAGFRSLFSPDTAGLLRDVRIDAEGTIYVDLHDLRAQLPGVDTACGRVQFMAEVEGTLRQFRTVRRVVLALEGEPRRFNDWLQLPCEPEKGACEEPPFPPPAAVP